MRIDGTPVERDTGHGFDHFTGRGAGPPVKRDPVHGSAPFNEISSCSIRRHIAPHRPRGAGHRNRNRADHHAARRRLGQHRRAHRQVRRDPRGRARLDRHRLSLARFLLRARHRDQGVPHRRGRRPGAGQGRAQDVPLRGAHGRDAAAPEHHADLRRRRGKRLLLRRHRVHPRRAHARRLLRGPTTCCRSRTC